MKKSDKNNKNNRVINYSNANVIIINIRLIVVNNFLLFSSYSSYNHKILRRSNYSNTSLKTYRLILI
jgi:hypothetical protein